MELDQVVAQRCGDDSRNGTVFAMLAAIKPSLRHGNTPAIPLGLELRRDSRFLAVCRWTRVYFAWRPNLRDEGDNHVVELAVAGSATAIVTRNVRDFEIEAELKFPGLEILTPAQLLRGKP